MSLLYSNRLAEKSFDLHGAHFTWMAMCSAVIDKSQIPFSTCAFCGGCIMVITQDLANLVHQFQAAIRGEVVFVFHYWYILKTKSGKLDGYYTALGICSGLFVHACLSALGISVILANSAVLFGYVKFTGALYLIWLGANSIYGAFRHNQPVFISKKSLMNIRLQPLRSFREGLFSNVLNPKPAFSTWLFSLNL
ncbi:LysE family translocator [Desulfosarcina alkanivorans]|uniref:LysE family translocator n=1 Tax=Desulfosarcina alkanivorans TaxID=571177 RepID=UPI001E47A607|nr:LysE family transporter [Desulfosarcina alkanivorans]